ncbi:MAG TPA: DNA-processing protein DprA [Myxococcales bacterium]|nr:DNA-processing protein DprA [Myxococcales bacterium]
MEPGTQSGADGAGAEVVAACGLSAIPGVGAAALARLARKFHSLEGAVREGPQALLQAGDELRLEPAAREYLAQDPDLPKLGLWAVGAARDAGARVVLFGDEAYPEALLQLKSPPPLLYVRGHLIPSALRAAVVGSRQADEQGMEIAREFGDAFARAGIQVISGGARGIDTAAHEGALAAHGTSVAVLGCGIDVAYPAENADLFARIAAGGAVISEFAPGTPPAPGNFPRRNRIVAALGDAVVVVRAALRSGALITAEHAADMDRQIFAVPGDRRNALASGPDSLLRRRVAKAAPAPIAVLQAMGWPVPDGLRRIESPADASQADASGVPPAPNHVGGGLVEEALWRLLDETTPTHVDDLALRSQIPAREALRKLTDLELKGMVVQRPGKFFLRR